MAEAVGRQFELAGPCRPAQRDEQVGVLPVHRGGGPRRGGSCGIEVGHQPGGIDGKQVVRILEQLIEPVRSGSVVGYMVPQVAGLPPCARCLAEKHVKQHALVAGLVPCGEELVAEGLVEQAGHRTGAALGGCRLEEVVGGRGMTQDIEVGDRGVVAESGGEGEPGRVVQPGAACVGERGEQPAVAFAAVFRQLVEVLAQRLANPGRYAGRIESSGGRVDQVGGGGQRDGGHRGDQEVPPCPVRNHRGQPAAHRTPGAVLPPGGAGRARGVHPFLGEQGGGELVQAVEVEVGVAVEVEEAAIITAGDAEHGQQPAWSVGIADGQRPGGDGDPQPAQCRQLGQRLGDLPPVKMAGCLVQCVQHHWRCRLAGQAGEAGDQLADRGRGVHAGQVGHRGEKVADGGGAGVEGQPRPAVLGLHAQRGPGKGG